MEKIIEMSLGDRMKMYEKSFQTYVKSEENIVIRLDGDSFSKFTKGFRKPFDMILVETMLRTSEELFTRFSCSFVYTQSDEITLVIPSSTECVLGGKVQKLVSLTAGFCSAKFNKNFLEVIEEEKDKLDKEFYELLLSKVGNAWFDSRLFALEDKSEVFNSLLFRMRDAERNSISMLGYAEFSHKEMERKNSQEKKEMLLEKKGISWDELEEGLKYGYCIKRQTFEREPGVMRRRIVRFAKKFTYSQENVQLILSKEV